MGGKIYTVFISVLMSVWIGAAAADVNQAGALRAKYASLADALRNNPYKRPLHIESADAANTLKGDVYALVEHPFGTVSAALAGAAPWCDIMILPINTKDCHVREKPGGTLLSVRIGRKSDQPVKDAFPIEFVYRVAETSPEYFAVRLDAETGPMGTHDYRVLVEATPVENGKTFLHLRYSYGYGVAGRIAMQAYLATAGAGKVGFTTAGNELVGGMRGVIERNTMRYYLAIDAYLDAASAPPAQRLERRLAIWFDATEQYKRQLHELDRDAYLAMKRREVQRQQTAQESVSGPVTSGRI
jgi:hypothetical protein